MTEYKRVNESQEGDKDQRHRTKRQDSQPLFEKSLAWDLEPFSLSETPFHPRINEHAEILSRIPFSAQRCESVMQLQQTYGNRYVQRLIESVRAQTKLTVSSPNDVYEQEADRVAKQVIKTTNSQIQRQEEEEEELQAKPINSLQRQEEEEEEEIKTESAGSQPMMVSENLENRIKAARGGGHPLSDVVQEPMGRAFGADFSKVRVHTDSEADALNRQLGAKAFTTGQDVFFREGEYSPGSNSGRELIAHELTHVVQQTGGQGVQRIDRIGWKFWKKKKKKQKPKKIIGVPIIPPVVKGKGRRGAPRGPAVVPVLTPQDNFAGRSKARFGVGEQVNLDFRTNPAGKSAASFGGLNWTVAGGNATVVNIGNTGKGVLKVGSKQANLTLQIKRAGGKKASQVEANRNIPVVAPTDAHMEPESGNRKHYRGYPSAGFLGLIFLHPKDVSFKWGRFKEGYGQAEPTGEFENQPWATNPHLNVARGPGSMKKFTWVNIKGGSAKGSQMDGTDSVFSGALGSKPKYPQPSEFTWNIPWFYQCQNPVGTEIQFPKPAVHHAICNAVGAMSIEKKGAGPFTIAKNAANSNW